MRSLLVLALFGLLAYLTAEVAKEMFVTEARTRLERLPLFVLRLARHRLPAECRKRFHDEEWLPELHYVLRGTEGLPLTRFARALSFALSLFFAARKIARELNSEASPTAIPSGAMRSRVLVVVAALNAAGIAVFYVAQPVVVAWALFVDGHFLLGLFAAVLGSIYGGLVVGGMWVAFVEAFNSSSVRAVAFDQVSHFTSMWSSTWWDGDKFSDPWTYDYRSMRR